MQHVEIQPTPGVKNPFPSLLHTDGPLAPWQEKLAVIVQTMQEISRQQDPQEMVRAYAKRMKQVLPLDRRISLSRRDLEWPYVRVTRFNLWEEEINPWHQKEKLPVLEGGIFADLIYGNEPLIGRDFSVDPDDPAVEYLDGMRSLMAIPLYDGGVSLNMFVGALESPDGIKDEDVPEHVWMGNLFGRATQSLILAEQVRNAYAEINRELKVVENLQRSLLPRELPSIPCMRLAVSYQTSRYAGGDYYDFFPLEDDRWGILIADVSGHGTPAAVLMAVTHTVAHTAADETANPGRFLNRLNQYLSRNVTEQFGSFVTAFYGVFDPHSGKFEYASAGHNPPRIKRCGRKETILLNQTSNLPLGITADEQYAVAETQLRDRDRIVFYTDGITEAQNKSGELFGQHRLDHTLGSCGSSAEDILSQLLADVDGFSEGLPPGDDRTILVAEIR